MDHSFQGLLFVGVEALINAFDIRHSPRCFWWVLHKWMQCSWRERWQCFGDWRASRKPELLPLNISDRFDGVDVFFSGGGFCLLAKKA